MSNVTSGVVAGTFAEVASPAPVASFSHMEPMISARTGALYRKPAHTPTRIRNLNFVIFSLSLRCRPCRLIAVQAGLGTLMSEAKLFICKPRRQSVLYETLE